MPFALSCEHVIEMAEVANTCIEAFGVRQLSGMIDCLICNDLYVQPIDYPTVPRGTERLPSQCRRFTAMLTSSSSLLKNLEIGAFSVFLPRGSERSRGVVMSGRRPYAASSVGMRIRL
jgi:hypothetical protein